MSSSGNPDGGLQDHFMAVAFTQAWPVPSQMPQWHQHLTIFPWARGDLVAAAQALEEFALVIKPITATVLELSDFGHYTPLPVWLLDPVAALRSLHKIGLASLAGVAGLENASFSGDNYRPHITVRPHHPPLQSGDRIEIQGISLVQKVGDQRHIYKTIELSHD
jgi:hypothetical protein